MTMRCAHERRQPQKSKHREGTMTTLPEREIAKLEMLVSLVIGDWSYPHQDSGTWSISSWICAQKSKELDLPCSDDHD